MLLLLEQAAAGDPAHLQNAHQVTMGDRHDAKVLPGHFTADVAHLRIQTLGLPEEEPPDIEPVDAHLIEE